MIPVGPVVALVIDWIFGTVMCKVLAHADAAT